MKDISRYIKVTNILCVLFRLFTVATVIVYAIVCFKKSYILFTAFEWLSVIVLLLGNLSLNRNVKLINAFGKVGAKYGFKELI